MSNKIYKLSAEQILEIKQPEQLFSSSNFKYESHKLMGIWHPDTNKEDSKALQVFQHLQSLMKEAKRRLKNDTWNGQSSFTFSTKTKKYIFRFNNFRFFELGKMYVSSTKIMYVIDEEHEELYNIGIRQISNIKYKNKKMESEFSLYFPKILFKGKTNRGLVLIIEKSKDAILLADLLQQRPQQKILPEHTAWILSSLYNISVFLEFNNIVHNSILPTTVFVNTKEHVCYLLGGWWYSATNGNKLKALPKQLISILPKSVLLDKTAKMVYDRYSIKAIGVNCLGDKTGIGSVLLNDKTIPKDLRNWVRSPSTKTALEEYQLWDKAIIDIFGERKFVEFKEE